MKTGRVVAALVGVALVGALLLSGLTLPKVMASNEAPAAAKTYFVVTVDGEPCGTFQEVGGLGSTIEVVEYQDGEDRILRKRPGRTKYSDITLKRELVADDMTWANWVKEVTDGSTSGFTRSTVNIDLFNQHGQKLASWVAERAWPSSIKVEPEDGRLMETIVLVTEKIERVSPEP